MSDQAQGPGWWIASDGRWYPPATAPTAVQPTQLPPSRYLPPVAPPGAPPASQSRWKRFRSTPVWVQILAWTMAIFMVLFVVGAIAGPQKKKTVSATSVTSATPVTTVPSIIAVSTTVAPTSSGLTTPAATPTTSHISAGDKAKAIAILTAQTDVYPKLLAEGKRALGPTPYPDAYAGLAALNDPNSAASHWSTFNQKISKGQYGGVDTNSAYNQASDLYPGASQPRALTDWDNDIVVVDSDLNEWKQQATGWQISEITTAQLNPYEQKFLRDLSKARTAIDAMRAAN